MSLSGLKWRASDRQNPDIVGEAYYDDATSEYVVIVMRGAESREKRFLANYDPAWGVDISDFQEIKNVAAQLADELRKEEDK